MTLASQSDKSILYENQKQDVNLSTNSIQTFDSTMYMLRAYVWYDITFRLKMIASTIAYYITAGCELLSAKYLHVPVRMLNIYKFPELPPMAFIPNCLVRLTHRITRQRRISGLSIAGLILVTFVIPGWFKWCS